jgi:glycosyltransferase involved in cell wall biosynthesis
MKGLISIVVPILNRAHCVIRTLDSIVASAYRPIEIIVVDNGSTDDSMAVCKQWAERQVGEHLSVVVLQEMKNGGNAARNRGLAEVRGEYVAFFDSDDLFSGEALEDIAQAVEQEETDVLFLPVAQEVDGTVSVRAYQKSTAPETQIMNGMWSTASMVFRTQWLRDLGGWDERLTVWQDWELGLRVLLHQPRVLWLTSRAYHHIEVHSDSVSGANFGETLEGTLQTMRIVVEEVKSADSLKRRQRGRCIRALYFRARIMEGQLRREKNGKGAEKYRILAKEIIAYPLKPVLVWGHFLSSYTAAGGRGAWRLALRSL